jgi:hypothetical protein
MNRTKSLLQVLQRAALLLTIPGMTVCAADSAECEPSESCHPPSFLEFGSWVFSADPELIARCDGYQVLVVYANGTDMLFLDESARPRAGGGPAAEQGMSFWQFNFYDADFDIEAVSCEVLGSDKVQISGTASASDDDSRFQFRIVADTAQRSHTYEDSRDSSFSSGN